MSKVKHVSREQQQIELLFNGAFTENKPIGFPTRDTVSAYSNIFYWAHLVAHKTAEFPLHPHEGFEIMTFVFKGSVEHYDTASNVDTPLNAGDVQVIQAGSGVSHLEKITEGSELFQIWFDPDFSKSMRKSAVYKEYKKESFSKQKIEGGMEVVYVGSSGIINSITSDLHIKKISYQRVKTVQELDKNFTYSYYLLEGNMKLDGVELVKDDFYLVSDATKIELEVQMSAELFVIKTVTEIEYSRVIERYQ